MWSSSLFSAYKPSIADMLKQAVDVALLLNLLTLLVFTTGMFMVFRSFYKAWKKVESAVVSLAGLGDYRANEIDAAVSRVLRRRVKLLLDDKIPPQELVVLAKNLELVDGEVVPNELVAEVWQRSAELATRRLGDLEQYQGEDLASHGEKVARSLYSIAEAVRRNGMDVTSMLLGQAYECAGKIVEETLVAGWPTDEAALRAVLSYANISRDSQRDSGRSHDEKNADDAVKTM